jgi:HK97 family phage portal protein
VSLWFRRRPAAGGQRAIGWPLPWSNLESGSYADVDSSMSSMESSLQAIAVRIAVDLIASLTSELPVDVFKDGRPGQRGQQVATPSHLDDPAGDGNGREDWLYQAMVSWLLRGNLYGDILAKARAGYPVQVDLQHPDHVGAHLVDGKPKWLINGHEVPDGSMLHRRVNPVPGVLLGLSPISLHAADIGLSITLTRFGKQYFSDGAHPGAILTNEEKEINDRKVAQAVKDRFMAALRGRREPVVLGKGWKYTPIAINPEESQFLESRGFTAAECARIFGPGIAELLGYSESGTSLTYANISDRSVHLLVYALGKWLRRADRLLTSMLPAGQKARLNRDALLETTTLARYQAHASALQNRWKVPNEVREKEDLEPVPWGNEPITTPGQPGSPENDGGPSE